MFVGLVNLIKINTYMLVIRFVGQTQTQKILVLFGPIKS